MAAKKKVSKKKSVAKKKAGKGLATSWQQQLAAHAGEGKAPKEKALTGDYISIKGGKYFSLGGVKLGKELDCVVVAFNFEKVYYDTDFDENAISSPACGAISYDEDNLVPFDDAANKQCETCDGCPMNEWESGKGKGKACADRRRLALVVAGADDKLELKGLNIPPTSLKNWKAYINELDTLGIHPMQAAVNIHFDEDSTAAQPPLVFEFVNEVTSEKALNLTAAMLEPASKLIETPMDFSNYAGGKKASKKKASKKKSKKKSKFS